MPSLVFRRPAIPLPLALKSPPPALARSSLRVYLAVVILLATVPLAVLSFVLITRERDSAQAQLEEGLRSLARSHALLVDSELGATIESLTIVARSEAVTEGRHTELHAHLQDIVRIVPNWHGLYLTDLRSRVLLSTLGPLEVAHEAPPDDVQQRQTLEQGLAVIRGLEMEPISGRPMTSVQVPVRIDGEVRFILGAWIPATRWQSVLQNTSMPKGGFVHIFDGNHRILAHSMNPALYMAQSLPGDAPERSDTAINGLYRASLMGDEAAFLAWQRTARGGWGVGVGIPAEPVERARMQGLMAAGGGGLLSLAAGMWMAWLIGRRVTLPLRQLAHSGAAGITRPILITEIAQLRDALHSLEADRESAIDRLRATADELQVIFSTTPVGLAIAQDQEGQTVLRNTALMAMWGASPQQPEGTARVLQEGRELSPLEQPLQRCARQGVALDNLELEVIHPDGQTLQVLAHALPLRDANGRLRGAVAGFVDITQRVQAQNRIVLAEQRLRESRQMVELAQQAGKVGFFDYNFDDHRVHGTAGLAQLLGMPAQAFEYPWRQWLQCIDPRDMDQVESAIKDSATEKSAEIRFEFRSRERDDDPRWFASRCALMFGDGDEPVHLIGVVLDITEQKFAERDRADFLAEQQKARFIAENANRAKDEFLAMLGHELRNPLGAISAAAEVMNRSPSPEMADRARIIIQRQTRHLAHLMEDLLDVTRVISGKITLSLEPQDLKRCVESVLNTMQIADQLARHTLQLDLQPAWVLADATRTEQIINNLLTNALKYTPQDGTIRIATWQEAETGVLQLSDNGVGMSKTLVAMVFDLFVQGERSLDRRQGGLGVGLTLVRRLAELHGGRATAQSEGPHQGSCFTVYLPKAAQGRLAPVEILPVATTDRTIVIVEDNVDAREALRVMLEMDGYKVETAEDGGAGLDLILRLQPDAALVDIGLPVLNGLEVAAHVRRAGLTLRMVAVSGYGQAADVEQALAAGFDSHVIKPIDPMILAQQLS